MNINEIVLKDIQIKNPEIRIVFSDPYITDNMWYISSDGVLRMSTGELLKYYYQIKKKIEFKVEIENILNELDLTEGINENE